MSAVYYPGCDIIIPNPVCSDCPEKELGRVRSLWLQKASYTFADITDTHEWELAIQNNNVYVFPFTQGTFAMNEVLTQGFGNVDEDLDSYECVLACMEPNFAANRDFWNAMKKSHEYKIGWRTQTKIYYSDVAATIIPKFKIDNDLKSKVVWDLGFKFVQESIPQIIDMPMSVFDRCIEI